MKVKKQLISTIGVAVVACRTRVLITGYSLVMISHICRIVMLMAIDATKQSEIARRRMTVYTLIPFIVVGATKNREILLVMIPSRWLPCTSGMAIFAACRELCRRVVGVVRVVIISLMTTHAGIGRIVIVAIYMAICT